MVPRPAAFRDARLLAILAVAFGLATSVFAKFDITRNDNLAVYWGQDSGGNQGPLSSYCDDDTIDNIILAFLYSFSGKGSEPEIDLANTCSQGGNGAFPGTALADCSFMASQIEACQAKGKIVTLSLGGATGKVGFSNDGAAESLADKMWNMFLGGSSSMRPFGKAVLDGVDLDIEQGSPAHYAAFVNRIRSHAKGASKQYFVTAAPQCPFPDANIGDALNAAPFDAVYVQFYNNFCGLNAPHEYNFATWDKWAKTTSANKDIKVYIGAAASPDAAGQGYVGPNTLATLAKDAQKTWSSFGGVMLWDASEAAKNNNYDKAIKRVMTANAIEHGAKPRATTTASATAKAPPKATSSTQKPSGNSNGSDSSTEPEKMRVPTRTGKILEIPKVVSRFFKL